MSKKKTAVESSETTKSTLAPEAPTLSSAGIAEAVTLVDQAVAAIDPGTPAMTTTSRRRALKIRKGGEKYIPLLMELATTYGISGSGDISAMPQQLAEVQALVPLARRVQVLLKLVEDAELRTNSAMWSTATFVYSMLKPLAKRDGNVALALQPVEEFFSNGPTEKTTAKKAGITTTASTTPATIDAGAAQATTTPHA